VVILSRVQRNPYTALLCEGLRQQGLDCRVSDRFSFRWMWRARGQVDALHVHWLELFFLYPSLWRSVRRWASVLAGLALARASGVRVVYTVHNIWQHEGQRATLSWLANRIIFRLAHAVHVHDAGTAETLRREWGRAEGVHIIPHGNYITAYPNQRSRAAARQQLGLDENAFVYLFLGRVRPYKGVEELLTAFAAQEARDAVLLVAGEVHEAGYESELRRAVAGDARVRLHLRFVADDILQVYFNVCDVCVLPYRHVTTSGAAILAFSFQVPIVAPRLGCFVDLVGEDNARGILYDAADPQGLAQALRQVRQSDLPTLRAACAAFAQRLDWRELARQHAAMYQASTKGEVS
jgi:glycosyltransferase involved in cell wall biosynthesis